MGCGASTPKPAEPKPIEDEGPSEEELKKQKEEEERKAEEERKKQEEEEAEKKRQEEEEKKKKEEEEAEAKRQKEEADEKARLEAEEEEKRKQKQEEEDRRNRVLVITGPPGSVKSQLCQLLVEKAEFKHVSTGEAVRDAIKRGTETGLRAQEARKASNGTVPDELQLEIVSEVLLGEMENAAGWLLDGFPKNAEQIETLQGKGVSLRKLIVVDISDDELVRRAVGRRLDPVSHKLYHLEGLGFPRPPEDEEVTSRLMVRKDDAEDRVRSRIVQYRDTNPDLSSQFSVVLKLDGTKDPESELLPQIQDFAKQP